MRVAGARNQAEAEFIQGMLLEEGVPSMLRRSAGFDVPDFLAAGPRDILVPQSGVDTARQVLLEAELISPEASRPAVVRPGRLLIGLLIALAIGAAIVWIVAELLALKFAPRRSGHHDLAVRGDRGDLLRRALELIVREHWRALKRELAGELEPRAAAAGTRRAP